MHIVLVNPEIPQNTGNIARTCAATGAVLHLIEPLGFKIEDKYLKRAGLDYWEMVNLTIHPSFEEFIQSNSLAQLHFATTKAPRAYTEVVYGQDDYIVFGCETRGLPETLLEKAYDRCIRIPMREGARSLNLSNSVAIVLYEALRQGDFQGLNSAGALTGREDDKIWADYV